MKSFSKQQIIIAGLIQKDIAITKFPFKKTGQRSKISGDEILKIIKTLHTEGLIRKFGAIVRHQKAGFKNNALVVWSVPYEQITETGKIFASFSFISHCYERRPAFMNNYNIFTMLHSDKKSIASLIREIVKETGMKNYLIMKSVAEYKKTSPEYF